MNNKKTFIISSGIAAMVIAVFFATGNSMSENQPIASSLSPPDVPMLEVISGKPVTSMNEAKTTVGYDVKNPTYLPTGYSVQVMNADAKEKTTTILASPNSVSPQTTLSEFFNQQKGILIYTEENSPGFDVLTWFSSWVKDHSATVVSINGIQGAVHGVVTAKGFNGDTISSPAELVFVKNNAVYEIRGIISVEELMQIAQTL
ncbi:MAG: DUF4367 domain-containing protein [Nitrosotalea sp.]